MVGCPGAIFHLEYAFQVFEFQMDKVRIQQEGTPFLKELPANLVFPFLLSLFPFKTLADYWSSRKEAMCVFSYADTCNENSRQLLWLGGWCFEHTRYH